MDETKLEHVGISVADLDRAVAWYREHFGLGEVRRFEKPELKIKGATLSLGHASLEILQPSRPMPAGRGRELVGLLRRRGANHLSIGVGNAAAVHERLAAAGVVLVTGLLDARYFFCLDPDGTLIEVRQLK